MKINRLFSIAAAALMMVACSSEDTALKNTPAAGPQMQFTATIAAPGSGATTRTAYTESGTDINVTWSVGDEIALIHNGVKDVATVKTVNANGSATINGYVTGATNNENVTLYYPAARMISNGQGGYTSDPVIEGKKLTQDGTLKYIQDNLDFREGEGQLSVNGTEVTLKEPVKMAAENAIWKLALKDDAETPAALAASQLAIMIGSDTIASTAILSTAASTVYLAVPGMADQAITIGATVDEDTYSCTNEGVTLGAKYYQSTVTMTKMTAIDLSKLTANYEAQDGDVLTGTLNGSTQPYKITIADGATVTLDGVTINGAKSRDFKWAGITCVGDATIILKDGTTNTVKGFYEDYPGIHPAVGKTLTIQGTGSLNASSNGGGAGIGGGWAKDCGNIEIQGGTITATGGYNAAGIGSGNSSNCGNITISGGTVEATGGTDDEHQEGGAGIGSGYYASCGDITITSGVTSVTATKGAGAPNSIGAGNSGRCGTVTIGGVTTGNITVSPYTYPLTYPVALSAVTSDYVGSVVTTDGNVYATAKDATDAGKTAVAKICYVGSSTGVAGYTHGLALALTDEGKMDWSTAGTTCSGKNTSTPITGASWMLPSRTQWETMGATSITYTTLRDGFTSVGGSNLDSDYYWSSTEYENDTSEAWTFFFNNGSWGEFFKSTNSILVRACLAF